MASNFIAIVIVFFIMSVSLILFSEKTAIIEPGENNMISPAKMEFRLSSDKEVYHSSEEMKLDATIKTYANTNLTVRVYGIMDRAGNFRVSEERNLTAEAPSVNETFVFMMPSCYGCAGVSPGEYEIIMEAWSNGEMAGNCSKNVTLEK